MQLHGRKRNVKPFRNPPAGKLMFALSRIDRVIPFAPSCLSGLAERVRDHLAAKGAGK